MESKRFDPLIQVEPDGFLTHEVRSWSLDRYRLVGGYCDIFTTGMKDKWDQLVYFDLFAGAGIAKIHETGKTYLSSALIAMSIPNPFSQYILCEADPDRCEALQNRVKNIFPHLKYIPEKQMYQIRSNEKNLPLYYLSFYSKHPRGLDFYKQIERRISPQLKMDI